MKTEDFNGKGSEGKAMTNSASRYRSTFVNLRMKVDRHSKVPDTHDVGLRAAVLVHTDASSFIYGVEERDLFLTVKETCRRKKLNPDLSPTLPFYSPIQT